MSRIHSKRTHHTDNNKVRMGNQQTTQTLNQKNIEILVKTSGKSENEICQWYKEFHEDSDKTDRMNKRQFKVFYTNLRKNPNLEPITDHIFRVFDVNHEGTIDFPEFLIGYIATTDGTKRQKFDYAFEVYDINDDLLIDKKEAKIILSIICQILGLSEQDAKIYTDTFMISFDTNHDKVLTKTEFIDGCLNDLSLGKFVNPFYI